jgi:hypothetical protein
VGVFKADAQREFAVDYNSKINVVFFSSSNQMRRLSSGLKLSFPCDSNDILTRSRDSNGFSSFFSLFFLAFFCKVSIVFNFIL